MKRKREIGDGEPQTPRSDAGTSTGSKGSVFRIESTSSVSRFVQERTEHYEVTFLNKLTRVQPTKGDHVDKIKRLVGRDDPAHRPLRCEDVLAITGASD